MKRREDHKEVDPTLLDQHKVENIKGQDRSIKLAKTGEDELGALKLLPGVWRNVPNLPGRGWNMIALPFVAPETEKNLDYRLLVNQYNEELRFTTVDKAVPNRGVKEVKDQLVNSDQFVVTLDYEQEITQIAADDRPKSDKAGGKNLPIHHEPGLFLQMANNITGDFEIARLGSVPHGNSVFSLGKVISIDGPPEIIDINGLPIGVDQDLDSPYLSPYKHFHEHPFEGIFDPVFPNRLLEKANKGVEIVRTTELHFDTTFGTGGINNIPFIERQADASEMVSTFWIQELAEKDSNGNPKLRIQYSQTIMLDFFNRLDGRPGQVKWPHVAINTLEKVSEPQKKYY